MFISPGSRYVVNIGDSSTFFFDSTQAFSLTGTTDFNLRGGTLRSKAGVALNSSANIRFNANGGGGTLTKTGLGALTLSGSNSYSGGTTVTAGRLVGTAASLQGAITNDATVEFAQATSGTYAGLMVGTGGIAKTGGGALTISSSNAFLGDTALSGGTLLALTDIAGTTAPFVEDTTIFALVNYSGSWNSGLFTSNGTPLADGSTFTVGSQLWEIDSDRTSAVGLANFTGDYLPNSSFVAITAVPEPGTLLLVVAAAARSPAP